MPRSMTGYGRGDVTRNNRRFIVEIKSVNHRYNEISVRTPRILNQFEDGVRKILTGEINRGKTDVYISFESFSAEDVSIKLNEPLANAYVNAITDMKSKFSLSDDLTVSLLTRFPDVLAVERNVNGDGISDELWDVLTEAVLIALNQFIGMRLREGVALTEDILLKLQKIDENVALIAQRAPLVAQEYNKRLRDKISAALSESNFDETRFIMEITLFADKSCIDEELTRLLSHISQMKSILNETDSVGRKLDFLTQEMNREINTIASKSNDLEITKISVELKSELEKIREQVQNIE